MYISVPAGLDVIMGPALPFHLVVPYPNGSSVYHPGKSLKIATPGEFLAEPNVQKSLHEVNE